MVEVNNDAGDSKPKQLEPEHFRKMFIGGLSLSTTDEGLKTYYSQFGELLDCVVMRDGQSKKSRGFGFVTYSTKEEVDKAMQARPHEIDGKTADPKRAVPRDQSNRSESNISTKRLYVSGVREDHTDEDFNDYFKTFGTVLKVEIITDKATSKPRGFAFISFDDYDAVDQCVLQKSHMIKNFRCDVKKALSKDEISRGQQGDRDRLERGGRSRGNQRGGPPGQFSGRNSFGGRDGGSYGGGQQGGYGGGSSNWGGAGGYGGGAGGGGFGGGYGGAPAPVAGWGANSQGNWGPGAPSGGSNWGAGGGGASAGAWSGEGNGSWGGAPAGNQWGGAGGWSGGAGGPPNSRF